MLSMELSHGGGSYLSLVGLFRRESTCPSSAELFHNDGGCLLLS